MCFKFVKVAPKCTMPEGLVGSPVDPQKMLQKAPAHRSHRLSAARDFDISERMYVLIRKSKRSSEREGDEGEGMCVRERDI